MDDAYAELMTCVIYRLLSESSSGWVEARDAVGMARRIAYALGGNLGLLEAIGLWNDVVDNMYHIVSESPETSGGYLRYARVKNMEQ